MPNRTRRNDIDVQAIGGDTVLNDPRAGRTHVINASAAYVWEQLDGSASNDDIARRLAARYGIEESRARADVETITGSFEQLGLLAP